LVSIALLIFVLVAFFFVTEGKFRRFGRTQWLLRIVAAIPLAVSSIGHFIRTATYASIVPPIFSHPQAWVIFTGILELVGAIGLLLPKTTRTAAICIAMLMIAVFPANIYAANKTVGGLHMPGIPVRVAMQVIYILLVLLAGWGIPMQSGNRDAAVNNTGR
jgi:uncharacterized membrane protein